MRLERISVGDLVLAKIKGRTVYGEVLEIADGQVSFRPLCPAAGWRHANAREIVAHWRKDRPPRRPCRGRRRRADAGASPTALPARRAHLSRTDQS